MHFDPVTRVFDLSDGLKDIFLPRFFFSRLYLSDSIFFKDSLDCNVHNLMKRFFPDEDCHGSKKKTFF